MSDEISLFKWFAGGAIGIVGALSGALWHDNRQRMKELTSQMSMKADKDEMKRIEHTQDKIFDLVRGVSAEINAVQLNLSNVINAKHLEVMAKLSEKQDRPR